MAAVALDRHRRVVTSLSKGRRRLIGGGGLALLASALAGCSSLGPASVRRDRTDYASVLATTWKEQTLLNVVKLRYADVPVYLDVASIISSTALESHVDLRLNFLEWAGSGSSQSVGAYGRYTDRPTISYTPVTGERFARYMLRPISPAAVFALIQAGYPVDRVLRLTTRGINGLFNRSVAAGRQRAADPAYYELIEAMRRVQLSEAIDIRIERRGSDEAALLLFRADVPEEVASDLRTARRLLRLRPGALELNLTFGTVPRRDTEIAMPTRSMAEILMEIAATAEVPAAHVRDARAHPDVPPPAQPSPWDGPLVRVHSGGELPAETHAAVRYRDHWYWIDDRDLASKSTFTFVLVLLSLAETGNTPQAPVITVPAN